MFKLHQTIVEQLATKKSLYNQTLLYKTLQERPTIKQLQNQLKIQLQNQHKLTQDQPKLQLQNQLKLIQDQVILSQHQEK